MTLGDRTEIMGIGFDPLTESQAIDRILAAVSARQGGWVVTPNVDVLRQATRDRSLRDVIQRADLVLADGMPVVWASRLQGQPLPARVAGSTLVGSLSMAAGLAGASVFLLGGNAGVAERAAVALVAAEPRLTIAGHHCPPMGFEDSPLEMEVIINSLRRTGPDIVFCGFGFPKQERLILELRDHFPTMWFLGIGVTLSFLGGEIRRCPRWMQDIGLEWLHRLSREPRRLFSRYILHDIPFALNLLTRAAFTGMAAIRTGRRRP